MSRLGSSLLVNWLAVSSRRARSPTTTSKIQSPDYCEQRMIFLGESRISCKALHADVSDATQILPRQRRSTCRVLSARSVQGGEGGGQNSFSSQTKFKLRVTQRIVASSCLSFESHGKPVP